MGMLAEIENDRRKDREGKMEKTRRGGRKGR